MSPYTYRTPGVYFESLDAPRGLQPAATHIACFVGIARRGPLHTPLRIESWDQFTSLFGRHTAQGYLAYAVEGFFTNGGQVCYVVRVADPETAASAYLDLLDPQGWPLLRLTASSPGIWAHRLRITLVFTRGDRFNLTLELPDSTQEKPTASRLEVWQDLSFDEMDERYALRVLNGVPEGQVNLQPGPSESSLPVDRKSNVGERSSVGSFLVVASLPSRNATSIKSGVLIESRQVSGYLSGGADGLQTLSPAHLSGRGAPPSRVWGLAALESMPQVAIVGIPDLYTASFQPPHRRIPPQPRCDVIDEDESVRSLRQRRAREPESEEHPPAFSDEELLDLQFALVAHCERRQDRFALLTPAPQDSDPMILQSWRRNFTSSYAALYFPWLQVSDPLQTDGSLRQVPPIGHVAGAFARAELRTGVHKPPANEVLKGVRDVTVPVDDAAHGFLNDNHVNVIRPYPGRGILVYGARTLSREILVRYVNVRRLVIMIRRTLEHQTNWLVFEPNNLDLWRELDRVLRTFLERLWQRGMLEGRTADQAYFVVCNQITNPPEEIEGGRLIAQIGIQPPWPAEFVVVRIGKTESGVEILEEKGR